MYPWMKQQGRRLATPALSYNISGFKPTTEIGAATTFTPPYPASSITMPLRLETVTDENDIYELTACQCLSFDNPPQPFHSVFFPVLGHGPDAREEAVREFALRQTELHKYDPTSHWQKIVDSDTGELVGGALWKICESNPFKELDEPVVADWHPEGPQRDFMTQALQQFVTPRVTMIPRPHVFLNILFTHPDHRRKGAGDLAMEWGLKKADELGLEMWLDASPLGLPLYKRHGLITVHETVFEFETENPCDEWNRVKEEFGHVVSAHMWRPAYGKLQEGQAILQFSG